MNKSVKGTKAKRVGIRVMRDNPLIVRHKFARRKPLKVAEALARDIVDYIVDEDLQEGTRLPPEREMLADTGRARSTLREALRLLETRGVVEIRQGIAGGPVVRRPRPADLGEALTLILLFEGSSMLDIIEAREEMEVLSVRRAGPKMNKRELEALQVSINKQLDCIENLDVFLSETRRFHAIINQAAGSRVLGVLNEALQMTTHVSIREIEYSLPHRRNVAKWHQRILDAIKVGDHDGACAAMRQHVVESGKYWRERAGTMASRPVRWLPNSERQDR
jgi:DNA-binding FadR family transcriptional regulator